MVDIPPEVQRLLERLHLFWVEPNFEESMLSAVYEEDDLQENLHTEASTDANTGRFADPPHLPIQRRIPTFEAQDPLVEVNMGTESELRMTKISGVLIPQ